MSTLPLSALPANLLPTVRPPLERFAAPLWNADSPEWILLDQELPHDHLARRIDRAVDRLDLTSLFDSYAGTGSKPYRPDLLLKVVLYELRQGESSPTHWAEDLRWHGIVRWLARGMQPSRTRLYVFRDRLGPFLDVWHEQILATALEEGVTTGEQASIDGTTIAANASRHHLLNQKRLDSRLQQLEQALDTDRQEIASAAPAPDTAPQEIASAAPAPDRAPQEIASAAPAPDTAPQEIASAAPAPDTAPQEIASAAPAPDTAPQEIASAEPAPDTAGQDTAPAAHPGWMASTPSGRLEQAQHYRAAQPHLHKRLADNQRRPKDKRLPADKVRISVSDPEAALGLDKTKVYRPLYNVQLVPDLASPLILAWEVFAQATDSGTLPQLLPRLPTVKDLLADAGYATALDLAACALAGVTLYAPYQANDFTARRPAKPAQQLSKDAFTWLPEEQTYRCPQGHRLKVEDRERKRRADGQQLLVTTYRCPGEHCRECPFRQRCARFPEAGRTVQRHEHEELVEALRERMATPQAKALYRRRGQTAELGYADLKEHRCVRRFSGRGQKRVRIQVGLTVLVHNLFVVESALGQCALESPPLTPEKIAG